MHSGKSYNVLEFITWTKNNLIVHTILSIIPVFLYQILDWKWIALPWTVVALLGTATAFIVGFKNTQTYNRTWEARQIWGAILNNSRVFGIMTRDFLSDSKETKDLYNRHFAWVTVLRYQMREHKPWENIAKKNNIEYQKNYSIPEKETPMEEVLKKYLSSEELSYILTTKNRAAQLLSNQSKALKKLKEKNELDTYTFVELEKLIKELYEQQGKSERIKNFPYPRQFATINAFFIKLFAIMLPFGMLKDFDKLNEGMTGVMSGQMVWLVVPFSILISWIYTSLDEVGESTENPFEGSANDVPISQISRTIEIDMLEMLGETDLPPALQPKNNIIL